MFNRKLKREVAVLRLAVSRVDALELDRRVRAIEPAVFPRVARQRLKQEVRYYDPATSDEALLAEFRDRGGC